ncbi:MAG: tetratricopeptide repeat protein [Planctomycetota bacterium]|jgi:tetratricopeptide (TPR) repeat protein
MRSHIPATVTILALLAGCSPFDFQEDKSVWYEGENLNERPIVTYPERTGAPKPPPRAPTSLPRNVPRDLRAFLDQDESRMDPGVGALLFAAEDYPGLPIQPFLQYLDKLASAIRHKTGGDTGPDTIDTINQFLFFDLGFRYDPNDPGGVLPDNLYLHKVLQRKMGYCVSLAVLYLALGKRLGIPVKGVRVPSHFIVRYDDGKTVRNIETTDFGIDHPDSYYIRKYRIAGESLRRGVYLAPITLHQVFADLFNNRGTLRGVRGEWGAALRALNRGIEIDPSSPFLYYNRGVILSRRGDIEGAVVDFRKALELDPNNVFAINNIAEILANRGEYERALAEVNRALNVHPKYSNGYLNRGVILHKMGNEEAGFENINRAIKLDDHNAMAYVFRARIYRAKKDYLRAIYDLNRAVASDPNETQAWAERGFTYMIMGRMDRSLPDFDKAVELGPGVLEYRLNRGVVRLKSGDKSGARRDFDKAVDLAPGHPEPLLKRAALSLMEGRTPAALADLDRASKLRPEGAEIQKQLGLLYKQVGDAEKTAFHLRRFLALEKGKDPEGRARVTEILEGMGR